MTIVERLILKKNELNITGTSAILHDGHDESKNLNGGEQMTTDITEPDVESSVWIARPPEAIWDYLSDVSNETQWRDIMIEARWVSEPPYGLGSTGLNVVKGVGNWPWRVTEWEEQRSVSWDVTGGRFEGSQGGYRLSPEDAGCRVTVYAHFKRSAFMRILRLFITPTTRRQYAAELQNLKAIMEA